MQSRALFIHHDDKSKCVDVILHDVIKTHQGYQLAAGKVLDDTSLMQLVNILSGSSTNNDLLPSNVLFQQPNLLVWWKKPHAAEVIFQTAKYKRFPMHYPTLIFFATPGSLHVASVKSSTRPTEDSRLFYAPIMNSDSRFEICQGNMTLPRYPTVASIPDYERFFYEGASTHLGVTTIKGVNDDDAFVAFVKAKGKKPFDKALMQPSSYNLKQFIELLRVDQ